MSNGSIQELQSVISDLEIRLKIALLSAHQVWWEWDLPSGTLKTHAVNDCILGYDLSKISQTLDFWMDALPPEEREPVWESLQEHFAGKTEMWAMEHRYADPHGEYKWVFEMGKVVAFSPDGKPLRMVGTTRDIHDLKMQAALVKENAELKNALKDKDGLLASASHDMKNALNSGWGIAQLLKEESIGVTKEFSLIEDSLRQSIDLISNIHELAIGHDSILDLGEVDLRTKINESRKFYALIAQSKGVELRVKTREGNSILADGRVLRRIIDNLLGNAVKFTSSGYVSISDLSTETTVVIEVSDSGCGVPADQEKDLFTPFKKLSSKREGSGLGLSISRDLAEKMSGTLTYRPNTSCGSIFRLEIPRVP